MSRRSARSASPFEARYGFSRAVRYGDRILVAGTAPIPPDGEEVAESAYGQMMRCGEIALAAIAELGGSAADVVRTRMFLVDPADADEVGRAHHELFGAATPAATMLAVEALLDPAWKVEIEVEAAVASSHAAD
jgi:enamine deaminase RidA (YjgF/YER057c/UK114 family)